jgi:hypothetical protein
MLGPPDVRVLGAHLVRMYEASTHELNLALGVSKVEFPRLAREDRH